ncbi:MAG TPA: hypothetical protein VFM49_00410 [Chloroflexia bacterium]|jgi:hypothetical protein|nr:hypothetical protein [Chloroflexia bacterium]
MTLAQQSQIAASLLWLALILGPPLALALGAGMIYMDGATRGLNTVPVRTDNRAILLLLMVALAVWVLLLKFLYLPIIGFDAQFLSLNYLTTYNYADIRSVQTLWHLTRDWVATRPFEAVTLLSFVPLISASVLIFARALGRSAALPGPPQRYWR